MFNWFKQKKHPNYWKEYLSHFKKKLSKNIDETRFVVFDTETTGLNITSDKILSIGAVAINQNRIDVSDSFEIYLKQEEFNAETVEIHGLLKEGNFDKHTEEEAVIQFLNYLKNSVIVAHHAAFDVAMINSTLKRLSLGKLKNKVIDTGILYKQLIKTKPNQQQHFSLDNLAEKYNIPQSDRHTASGDAFITALVFLKIMARLNLNATLKVHHLLTNHKKEGLL